MRYSERLEFEITGMPGVQLRSLSPHRSRNETGGSQPAGRPRRRHDIYMEIPGMLTDRETGRSRIYHLTVFLGTACGKAPCWEPDPGLMAWMKRRGHVRNQRWRSLEDLQWEVRRMARWDHLGATQEALERIQKTTGG